jgi:hypothetical protein
VIAIPLESWRGPRDATKSTPSRARVRVPARPMRTSRHDRPSILEA